MKQNRVKTILAPDGYGKTYVKNFGLWADGCITMQTFVIGETQVKNVTLRERKDDKRKI